MRLHFIIEMKGGTYSSSSTQIQREMKCHALFQTTPSSISTCLQRGIQHSCLPSRKRELNGRVAEVLPVPSPRPPASRARRAVPRCRARDGTHETVSGARSCLLRNHVTLHETRCEHRKLLYSPAEDVHVVEALLEEYGSCCRRLQTCRRHVKSVTEESEYTCSASSNKERSLACQPFVDHLLDVV